MAFDLEAEAWRYARGLSYPQTEAQIRLYVNDWLNKDEQIELGMHYFERDVKVDLRGKKLLEFGSGAGAMAFAIEKRGVEVTGVDVDERVVDISQRWAADRGSKCRFLVCTDTLPLDDAQFDLVYSSSAFEHVAKPEKALREIARVLRPGGLAYLNFPNRLWPIEGHTGLRLLPWLPRPLAERYLAWKIPGWKLDSLWFYSYIDFYRVLRRSKAPLRVVCSPVEEGSGPRRWLKSAMHRIGVPYSALTEGLAITLERF